MPKIQASCVFWLECILQGLMHFTRTRIARQLFDQLKNHNQIWIDNIKTINQPPKILFQLNYKLNRSSFCDRASKSVLYQCVCRGPMPFGKTPIARQPFVQLKNRIQIWIDNIKTINQPPKILLQLNYQLNRSFSESAQIQSFTSVF